MSITAPDDPYDPSSVSKESTMKKFRCGDVVPGCTRAFVGSPDEILLAVHNHARADHGLSEMPAGLVAQVRSAMADA
ncbi:DUF1059 domain-containing protein [Kineococcus rubinsiae]|uniref:DUF1059 domain-containing protein n=1 Tax=Kineococcus rubinsiae TaxID=2609562 RepID=UPI0027E56917|nr:DUF1059 domain-containing protein [Kineococcus rubinsiae]